MEIKPAQRIIFLDLMRFLALVMMIQGHTIHSLIDQDAWFQYDNWFFPAWERIRGYTAPVFLMVAGTVFTYLLVKEGQGRIRKGIKRAFVLLFFGYLLRFPFEMFVEEISTKRISAALSMDVLQLIGIALLVLCLIYKVSGSKVLRMGLILLLVSIGLLIAYPFADQFDWTSIMPEFLAAWFSSGTGSQFPLIPWLVYLMVGGMIGLLIFSLQSHPKAKQLGYYLLGLGIFLLLLAEGGDLFERNVWGQSYYWDFSPNLIFHRMGIVFMIMGSVFFLAKWVQKVPYWIHIMSKNTLWIYIVHLFLLYSVIKPSFHPQFSLALTLLCVAGMFALMLGLAWWIEKKLKYTRGFQALN